MDRLSDLPGDLIEKVIGYLPMAEGARTCVLSKKWRHKWEEAPQLLFDRSFVTDLHKRRGPISESHIMKTILYEVLLAHSGSVNKFTLSIPQLESCPEIDRIIRFLAKKNVQDFKLTMLSGGFHKLPSHMFLFEQLLTFKLYSCILEVPSTFRGFNKLVNVEFVKVMIDSGFFESFISRCPQLERLVLDGCISDEPCSINIDSPSLTHFNYTGTYKSVCFPSAPVLQVVSIYNPASEQLPNSHERLYPLGDLTAGIPKVQSLSVDNYFLKAISMSYPSRSLSESLDHLKILEAFDLCLAGKEMQSLFGLIKNSPNLEVLKIEMVPTSVPERDLIFGLLGSIDSWFLPDNKIVKMIFLGFEATAAEMELIRTLLSNLPVLKMMYIQPPPGRDDSEQLRIVRKILRFRRASSALEIVYGD